MFELQNGWTDYSEIWFGHYYGIGGEEHPFFCLLFYLFFPSLSFFCLSSLFDSFLYLQSTMSSWHIAE
jgi:hypothetical protein